MVWSLTVDHDFGPVKLVSITAYRSSSTYRSFTATASATPSQDLINSFHSKQFTQELQLVSDTSSDLSWVLGAYYFRQDASAYPSLVFFRGPLLGANSQTIGTGRQVTNSVSGFAQGTYSVTPSTRLTAGFRYTYEQKDFNGSSQAIPAATGIPGAVRTVTGEQSFKKPTWRLAVDQDLADNVLGYISYSRGFKSGGFSTSNPTQPAFDPELIDAYEIGLKSEPFDRRVRLNLAGFYYDYTNIQVSRYTTTGIIYNAEGAKIYGVEGDLEARVTDALHLNASISVMHTEFSSFPQAQFTIPRANNQGATLVSGDATGNRLPYSPKFSYTLGADYRVESGIGPVTFNVTDSYNSGYFGEVDNRLYQKAFHLLNTSVAWKSVDEHFGVRLWVNNWLNEAIPGLIQSQATGYIAAYSNPPRTYGLTLQASF